MNPLLTFLFIVGNSASALALAPSGPWDNFNYAPTSRTVYPTAIYRTVGDVSNAEVLLDVDAAPEGSFATVSGEDSYVSLDFGIEVCT